jgi:hypothetical protein
MSSLEKATPMDLKSIAVPDFKSAIAAASARCVSFN